MKKALLLLSFLFLIQCMFSQGTMKTRKWRKSELDTLEKAQMLFEEQNYVTALPLYEAMQQNHPKEIYLKYILGICGLYRGDYHSKSLDLLLQVYEKNKKAADIEFDIARAYHYNYKFDEALAMIDKFLKHKNVSVEQRNKANQLINYCNNGKMLVASPVEAEITNIAEVNTEYSEYVPVISSDENTMLYTYRGEKSTGGRQNAFNQPDPLGIYYEDVFITHKENGKWLPPESIGENINTNVHDAAIGISNDGQRLFIFRDNSYDGGDIYISKLQGNTWGTPEKLKGSINTSSWEGSASLSADEKTIYFSSEAPGGYGGKDIYSANMLADSSWGNIKNLGATINTALDDDAPFVHPDGKTLLFSSQGHNSMGGYDIFTTQIGTDSSWSNPVNIGYPINTPDEDYLVVAASGITAYYASAKDGGVGLYDIYSIDVSKVFKAAPVFVLSGITTTETKPVETHIKVINENTNSTFREFASNSVSGNYLVNLPAGAKYKITYSLNGFPDQIINIDAFTITGFTEKKVNIDFSIPKDTIPKLDSLVMKNDTILSKVDSLAGKDFKDPGDISREGLEFKVQIAAFNMPKNYNYDKLKGLGKVEKLLLADGITRFTIGGSFKTLNEATAHKNKVQAAGQKDAFVTAIYKGKRVYLEELEQMGIIPAQPK